MLVLAVLWWAWVGLRLADERDRSRGGRGPHRHVRRDRRPAHRGVRASPRRSATGRSSFAVAYGVVRARPHRAVPHRRRATTPRCAARSSRSRSARASASALLVGASFVDAGLQAGLWVAGDRVDWGGPALFGIGGGGWFPATSPSGTAWSSSSPSASRSSRSASAPRSISRAGVVAAAVLGVALAAALWWIYFDVVALVTARRLTQAPSGPRAQRAGPRLLLLPALPDGRGHRARRLRPRGVARPRRRPPRRRAGVRAARRRRASTCSRTSRCGSATRTRSTSSAWCSVSVLFALIPVGTVVPRARDARR